MKGTDINAVELEFLRSRSKAIEGYSQIENVLCVLVAALLGTQKDLAGIVFFKITAARARNSAVEGLLKKRFGTTYNIYWNSLVKLIGQVDQRRNEIVHWTTVHNIGAENDVAMHEYTLTPPNIWAMTSSTQMLTVHHMQEFADKCDFIARSITMFQMVAVEGHQFEHRDAWLQIFREECTYPPPDTHRISRKYTGP